MLLRQLPSSKTDQCWSVRLNFPSRGCKQRQPGHDSIHFGMRSIYGWNGGNEETEMDPR